MHDFHKKINKHFFGCHFCKIKARTAILRTFTHILHKFPRILPGFSPNQNFWECSCTPVPSPRGAFGGLSPKNKALSPPIWNMKHYKSVKIVAIFSVNPPAQTQSLPQKRKAHLLKTFWRRFCCTSCTPGSYMSELKRKNWLNILFKNERQKNAHFMDDASKTRGIK